MPRRYIPVFDNAISIDVDTLRNDIRRTQAKLSNFSGKQARSALRKATARSGKMVLARARKYAPKGEVGLLRRSLDKKAYTRAAKGIYMSIVGQKLSRAGGRESQGGGVSRAGRFSARQISKARQTNYGISTGISGQGKAVPIHFTTRKSKPHTIRAKNRPLMWFNRGKNNQKIGMHKAVVVRHPGIQSGGRQGLDWLEMVKRRSEKQVMVFYRSALEDEIAKL